MSRYASVMSKGRAGHPLLEPLPLYGKKSSGTAAYRYLNKKVVPLPLLACKTAAACRCRYFKNMNSKKNDGIQMRYLILKFQLYL